MEFRTWRDRRKVIAETGGKSMTHQEFKRDCDINYLVAKVACGDLNPAPVQPVFFDATDIPDNYQDAVALVHYADNAFQALPAKVRDRFANNPISLFKFLLDPANRDEALGLGLLKPAPAPVAAESAAPDAQANG